MHQFKAVTLESAAIPEATSPSKGSSALLAEDLDAAYLAAAYPGGYRDAIHFDRGYKSIFEMRDIQQLRRSTGGDGR